MDEQCVRLPLPEHICVKDVCPNTHFQIRRGGTKYRRLFCPLDRHVWASDSRCVIRAIKPNTRVYACGK